MNDTTKQETPAPTMTAEVKKNGPLLIRMPSIEITHSDGRKEIKENVASFCRCGLSANKPFCDGAHRGKFEG